MLEIARIYIQSGFIHVLPLGFDHILFILSLFFFDSKLKTLLIQCSVFTLAHSITLCLTTWAYLLPDAKIIEPLIACSILFTSIENISTNKSNKYRILIIFGFGLIHGMGFAGALKEIGLPESNYLSVLLFFNFGVELGQIAVILAAYLLIGKWYSEKIWYKERLVYPLSTIIACIALFWTIEKII